MKQLIIFPTGTLKPSDKARLSKEGFIAIEADDPARIVCAVPTAPLATGDDMLMAAMVGAAYTNGGHSAFFMDLHKRMKAREKAAAAGAQP